VALAAGSGVMKRVVGEIDMISKTELSVAGIVGVVAGMFVWAGYITTGQLVQKLGVLTLLALVLVTVLFLLCLVINKVRSVPLQKTSTDCIINWGYWIGFVVALFCAFHVAPVAASSSASTMPAPLPATPQPPPAASQSIVPPIHVMYPPNYKGPDVYGVPQPK